MSDSNRQRQQRSRQPTHSEDYTSHWVDRAFDRVERYPRTLVKEYRRFVWHNRLEGAALLLLILIILFLLIDRFRTPEEPLPRPTVQRIEPSG